MVYTLIVLKKKYYSVFREVNIIISSVFSSYADIYPKPGHLSTILPFLHNLICTTTNYILGQNLDKLCWCPKIATPKKCAAGPRVVIQSLCYIPRHHASLQSK